MGAYLGPTTNRLLAFQLADFWNISLLRMNAYAVYCRDVCGEDSMSRFKEKMLGAKKIVVFSGSGLSATSGMSTFSTKGGLYERAQRRYGLSDGKVLFTYSFYSKHKKEAESFFVEIHREALEAKPGPGHEALASLARSGMLTRHYTLNIDGLASKARMDVWHPDDNNNGITVEMHGSIHELVCTECGNTRQLTQEDATTLSEERSVPCTSCSSDAGGPYMRFKVMMYDDMEGDYIISDDVLDLMEEDVKQADLILWVGISFQQSASTSYFRRVRRWVQEVGHHHDVPQVVVNPSDDALWNVLTACSNQEELNIIEILGTADSILPMVAKAMSESVTTPHPT